MLGLRALGFRVLGLLGLGLRAFGFRVEGFWGKGFRVSGKGFNLGSWGGGGGFTVPTARCYRPQTQWLEV